VGNGAEECTVDRVGQAAEEVAAQERAVAALVGAMAGQTLMQCLLQGDVGSGKTAVVFAACLAAVAAGGQCLVMAPTAVLAEQHAGTLGGWGEPVGVRIGLLH